LALATMFRLVLCFMIILFSLDPRTQHFKFTTLAMSDPTAASCSLLSSLLPCHCASRLQGLPHTCSSFQIYSTSLQDWAAHFKFVPHLCRTGQLISTFYPTFLQDWAAEPVGNLPGMAQVNEEEQESQQWFRARIPASWCQSGAGRYGTEA